MEFTPTSYRDFVFPDQHTAQLVEDIVEARLDFPANGTTGLLLYGPPGTGKTSLATLLPREMQTVRHGDYIDPASVYPIMSGMTGSMLLKTLMNAGTNVNPHGTYHYFILDEVDLLGFQTMNSLKQPMNLKGCVFIRKRGAETLCDQV